MNRNIPSPMPTQDADITSYYASAVDRAKRYYKLLYVLLAAFTVLVIVYVHAAEPVYLAVAALSPPKDALLDSSELSGSSGLASIGRRLGFGIRGAGSGENYDLFDEYTRVLQSYRLASALADSPAFLRLTFPRRFDPQTGHLKTPQGAGAAGVNAVKSLLGLPLTNASDDDQVYRFLATNLTISQPRDPTTSISEVTLRYNDPAAAQNILEIILAKSDSLMRDDKRKDIVARIAYLQQQLQAVTLEDQRSVLVGLLGAQQNTMMMIAADHRYASYVVEPPHTPRKAAWPNTAGIIGLVLFLSFLCWSLAIWFLPERMLRRFSRGSQMLPWPARTLAGTIKGRHI